MNKRALQPSLPLHVDPTLPLTPDFGNFAEAVITVLRLGYVVVPVAAPSDDVTTCLEATAKLLTDLRSLGWPLSEIPLIDGRTGYTLKGEGFTPPWTFAMDIPVITMREH